MIARSLPEAAQALASAPGEAGLMPAGREQPAGALHAETGNPASREIMLQAPVASGLRFLLSMPWATPELERSRDLVMQVAARTGPATPCGGLAPRRRALAGQTGDLASRMRRQADDQLGYVIANGPQLITGLRLAGRCGWPACPVVPAGKRPCLEAATPAQPAGLPRRYRSSQPLRSGKPSGEHPAADGGTA
jgi:hypothetical protein